MAPPPGAQPAIAAERIRVIAIAAVISRSVAPGRLLAMEVRDPNGALLGLRPLGGGLEFGETAAQALARELREEIGAELVLERGPWVYENVFDYAGRPHHEIVFAYAAHLTDPALEARERFVIEEPGGPSFVAVWTPLDDLTRGRLRLFPPGLLADLAAEPGDGAETPQ